MSSGAILALGREICYVEILLDLRAFFEPCHFVQGYFRLVARICRGASVGSRISSQQRACLVEFQARTAGTEFRAIAVADIAKEIRLHVTFGKEFLLTVFAFACTEEFFIHLGIIEP